MLLPYLQCIADAQIRLGADIGLVEAEEVSVVAGFPLCRPQAAEEGVDVGDFFGGAHHGDVFELGGAFFWFPELPVG